MSIANEEQQQQPNNQDIIKEDAIEESISDENDDNNKLSEHSNDDDVIEIGGDESLNGSLPKKGASMNKTNIEDVDEWSKQNEDEDDDDDKWNQLKSFLWQTVNSDSSSDDEEVDEEDSKSKASSAYESIHAAAHEKEKSSDNAKNGDVLATADRERQILLLMLLAQVCALHDPTPRTFTVHVLELYERGILDRDSIGFLFDLGLVPQQHQDNNNAVSLLENGTPNMIQVRNNKNNSTSSSNDPMGQRVQEAAEIRNRLIRHESQASQNKDEQKQGRTNGSSKHNKKHHHHNHQGNIIPSPPVSPSSSWMVEHFPLSLSRYQREFIQVKLLSAGAFGHVYQSTNKLDGRDYAVKRIVFSETGYSNATISQAVREVQCLAQCSDHPNCVRYSTAWLEPSWVTGGVVVSNPHQVASQQVQHKMLGHVHRLVLMRGPDQQQQSSVGNYNESTFFDSHDSNRFDVSSSSLSTTEYTNDTRDWDRFSNSIYDEQSTSRYDKTKSRARPRQQQQSYRYQMCFYIQMQLCLSTTLADWIRDRNNNSNQDDNGERVDSALCVFHQIVSGLAHVHQRGIIHRDLKPANVFLGHDGFFKIGDFGLSKVLHQTTTTTTKKALPLLLPASTTACTNNENNDALNYATTAAPPHNHHQDPLTSGVGTASYMAPEQTRTNCYDSKADIFSLGLILLELVCHFGTEHERIQTFHDCRRQRIVPSWLKRDFPHVADMVLQCTETKAPLRPSATDILATHVLFASTTSFHPVASTTRTLTTTTTRMSSSSWHKIHSMMQEKDDEISRQRHQLEEQEKTIEELKRQVNAMQKTK